MSVKQTVEIPANRRLTIDVPLEIPVGKAVLIFTPAPQETQAEPSNHKSISKYFGILSPGTYGDSTAYQRNLRDEWDD